ncbi:MAG TPA: DNA polymerase III subunit delta', partial [Burkholderiaceae bacterium]|nr:DNA polymerase III subunit delta' [Burkholderiaceae bacterium]
MIYEWHKEVFATLLANRQRHHALLLNGPPGIGKSALALALAAAGLCEQPRADGSACGACNACGWFAEGNHP